MLLGRHETEFSQYTWTSQLWNSLCKLFLLRMLKIRSTIYSVNFDETLKMASHLTLQLHILQHWRRYWLDKRSSEIGGVLYRGSSIEAHLMSIASSR